MGLSTRLCVAALALLGSACASDLLLIQTDVDAAPGSLRMGLVEVAATRSELVGHTEPSRCRWVPPDPGLWRRTIHCDWMTDEDWQEVRSWGLPILYTKRGP